MKTVDYICEKTGLSKEEVQKDYEKKLAETKQQYPALSNDEAIKRAEKKLSIFYSKMLLTGAVNFEGIVIGYEDATDRFDKQRRVALEAYMKDAQAAIKAGLVDSAGTPLISNKEKKSYGKPIKPFIARNIIGMAKAKGKGAKKFYMTFTGNEISTIPIPPLHTHIEFRAKIREDTPDMYVLDSLPETTFKPSTEKNIPPADQIISSYFKPIKTLAGIKDGQDVVLDSMITSLNLDHPQGYKSMMVSIDDSDMSAPPILVYMPRQFKFEDVAGLAEETKVMVWARVSKPKEDGTQVLNGYGIWVYPEWRSVQPQVIKKETVQKDGLW